MADESVLIVAGDHSCAPPQRRLIQGFCRSFSSALLGGVIPVGLQRASLFIWGLTQQAGGCSSVELSRGGNLFSRGGDPSSSYLHRGFLLGGQSGAGQHGDSRDMGFNLRRPHGFLSRSNREGEHNGIHSK